MQRLVGGWLIAALAVVLLEARCPAQSREETVPVPARDAAHVSQQFASSWLQLQRSNIVMQGTDYSCGAAALATLIQYFWGDPMTENELLKQLDAMLTRQEITDRITNGLTLTDLRRVAVAKKYQATIGKLEFQKLTESKIPVVLGIEVRGYRHFVVYRGAHDGYVFLADPARGNLRVPDWEFVRQWQENAVLIVAKPNAKIPDTSPLTVRQDEREIGWLNQQVVRRSFLPPRFPFPNAVRP